MGQVLYRKYRPQSLSQVIGQDHITAALESAIKNDKIAHAYLFTGPRGVGKTSVARILACMVNDIPYDEEASHLDIIEIDAASNRRIDEIRELRDKVNISPSSAKYKVYIIDEVHMLTREAFNALLKTLEEPPEHAIFILATTESHKLPETIISRTQRYPFKPVSADIETQYLASIAKKEKIAVDNDALRLIAEHGEGSVRDSLSLLDQLRNQTTKITAETVRTALGIVPNEAVDQIIDTIERSDSSELLSTLSSLYDQGYQSSGLAKQIGQRLRQDLVEHKNKLSTDQIFRLLRQLLDVPAALQPQSLLEVVLLQEAFSDTSRSLEVSKIVDQKKDTDLVTPTERKADKPANTQISEFDESVWPQLLSTIKSKHNTLYSFIRMAEPKFSNKKLELHFAFRFHQQRISEARNIMTISETLEELTGKNIEIICIFTPGAKPYTASLDDNPEVINDPNLETINNIFGNSEVIES